ncbi:alpha/beta hydrolase [Thermoleophilia bacterium SCSIO 60948]|nr:alpha/beta hydrolase [Thermoleophilia bacterium SCSIO 60948]
MTDGGARIARSGERLVEANGAEHCVECFGDAADPALLLIGNTMLSWPAELCELLAEQGRVVIRYDLRDTGRSTRVDPFAPAYTLRDLAADAAALLDALGVECADVAGLAPGGWVAQILALDHPERVRSLTLVATRPVGPGPVDEDLPDHSPELMRWFMSGGQPDLSDRDAALDHLTDGAVRMGGPAADEAEARRFVTDLYGRTEASLPPGLNPTAAHLSDQMAIAFSRLDTKPRWRERLGEIGVPTLVVHGSDDPFFPLGNGEALAREIPGARLLVIEGAGNWPPARAHAELAAAVPQPA